MERERESCKYITNEHSLFKKNYVLIIDFVKGTGNGKAIQDSGQNLWFLIQRNFGFKTLTFLLLLILLNINYA